MSDISSEQFERYLEEQKKTNSLLGSFMRSQEKDQKTKARKPQQTQKPEPARKKGTDALDRERDRLASDLQAGSKSFKNSVSSFGKGLNSAASMTTTSFRMLDQRANVLGGRISDLASRFTGFAIVGTIVEGIISLGEHWIDHYREMANVGQMFNGSMMSMAKTAADAGMPLADFAALVKKNSTVMAVFGVKDVTGLAKSVRRATREVGFYGFSVEGMNTLTAEWLDMQRMMGNQNAATSASSRYAIEDMAKNVTGLSMVFGESRDDIVRKTKELAASNDFALATLNDASLKTNKSFQEGMMMMAAMPGESGKYMQDLVAGMLNNSNTYFSSTGKAMNEAGLGEINSIISDLVTGLKSGAVDGFATTQGALDQMRAMIKNNSHLLANLRAINPAVADFVKIVTETEGLNAADVKRRGEQAAQMKKTSALLLTIGERIEDFKGRVLSRLIDGFSQVFGDIDKLADDPRWQAFVTQLEKFGFVAGGVIAKMLVWFTSLDPVKVANTIENLVMGMVTLAGWVVKLGTFAFQVVAGFQQLASAMFGEKNGGLIGAIGAIVTAVAAWKLGKNLLSHLGVLNVNAGQVFVNGKALDSLLPNGGGAGGEAGGKGRGAAGARSRFRMRGGLGKAAILAGVAGLVYAAYRTAEGSKKSDDTDAATPPEKQSVSLDDDSVAKINSAAQPEPATPKVEIDPRVKEWNDQKFNAVLVDANGNPLDIKHGLPAIPAAMFEDIPSSNSGAIASMAKLAEQTESLNRAGLGEINAISARYNESVKSGEDRDKAAQAALAEVREVTDKNADAMRNLAAVDPQAKATLDALVKAQSEKPEPATPTKPETEKPATPEQAADPQPDESTLGKWLNYALVLTGWGGIAGARAGAEWVKRARFDNQRSAHANRVQNYRADRARYDELKKQTAKPGMEETHRRRLERAETELSRSKERAWASNQEMKTARANQKIANPSMLARMSETVSKKVLSTRAGRWTMNAAARAGDAAKTGGRAIGGSRIGKLLSGLTKGGAGGLLKGNLAFGTALEGLNYLTGQQEFNGRNLAKSGLRVGGMALGGLAGLIGGGGIFSAATGLAGASAGGWLGDKLGNYLLPDDDGAKPKAKPKPEAKPEAKKLSDPATPAGVKSNTPQVEQLKESKRAADALEQRLPTPQMAQADAKADRDELQTMKQLRDINIAILRRLQQSGNQYHDIWTEIRKLQPKPGSPV